MKDNRSSTFSSEPKGHQQEKSDNCTKNNRSVLVLPKLSKKLKFVLDLSLLESEFDASVLSELSEKQNEFTSYEKEVATKKKYSKNIKVGKFLFK